MSLSSDRERTLLEELVSDASVLQFEEPGETIVPGECAYCSCTHERACVPACGWFRAPDYRGFGVCTSSKCVKAYLADQAAP